MVSALRSGLVVLGSCVLLNACGDRRSGAEAPAAPVSVHKRTADTIVRLIGHMLGDIARPRTPGSAARSLTR